MACFSLLFLSFIYVFICSDIQSLFEIIYQNLNSLSPGKQFNFCYNYQCAYDYKFSEKMKNITQDKENKFICMVNNSLYLLINETYYKNIIIENEINLNGIQKYNVIPYYNSIEDNINFFITFISEQKYINFYYYRINYTNIIIDDQYIISYLIKNHQVKETNLSKDLNCQIIDNYKMKCFYYKPSPITIKLFIATFVFDESFRYINESKIKELTTDSKAGVIENLIKSAILKDNLISVVLFSRKFAICLIYNYVNNSIIDFFEISISNGEKYNLKKNEGEIIFFEETNEILLFYKNNKNQIDINYIKNVNNNRYEEEQYKSVNITFISCKNNSYFLEYTGINSNMYNLTENCFDYDKCSFYEPFFSIMNSNNLPTSFINISIPLY